MINEYEQKQRESIERIKKFDILRDYDFYMSRIYPPLNHTYAS